MTKENREGEASETQEGRGIIRPEGTSDLSALPDSEIEPVQIEELEDLLALLSRPTQALTTEQYIDSIRQRQEAVNKHLLRGGVETVRRFFEIIRREEKRRSIKLDFSMLEISGKILAGLYLPGANLEKMIFTESDLTGSNLQGANLTEAVANAAILREALATGANFTNAVLPNADLSGGRFIGCTFVNTVMPDVIIDEDTNFAGARFIGTYIGNTDLYRANVTGAVIRGLRR